jgi:cysteine desulfurase
MAETRRECWGNPASVHAYGRRARAIVEAAREGLAERAGVHPRDVVFTSGGTEANNLALAGASLLVTSRIEHPSVTAMAEQLEANGGRVIWLPVSPEGRVSPEDVERVLSTEEAGAVVCVQAASHETGLVQPVPQVAAIVHARGARLHVDAVQWAAHRSLQQLSAADSLAISAHKLGGPPGIGALLFRGPPPRPLLFGGKQERGLRPGTQDASLARGFHLALEHADSAPQDEPRVCALRDLLEQALAEWGIVNGGGERLGHVSNVSFGSWSGPELVAALDLQGVMVSSGSACSAGTSEPSKAIYAMLGEQRAASAVRFSLGRTTTRAQILRVIHVLRRALA